MTRRYSTICGQLLNSIGFRCDTVPKSAQCVKSVIEYLVFFDMISVHAEQLSHAIQNSLLGFSNSHWNHMSVRLKKRGMVQRVPLQRRVCLSRRNTGIWRWMAFHVETSDRMEVNVALSCSVLATTLTLESACLYTVIPVFSTFNGGATGVEGRVPFHRIVHAARRDEPRPRLEPVSDSPSSVLPSPPSWACGLICSAS